VSKQKKQFGVMITLIIVGALVLAACGSPAVPTAAPPTAATGATSAPAVTNPPAATTAPPPAATLPPPTPNGGIIFHSSQFAPVTEAEAMRKVILKDAGMLVDFQPQAAGPFVSIPIAQQQAGKVSLALIGGQHGANRALFHTPGMTRIEMWRRVTEMIRVEIGAALWLGCGCPLWASVGLVDGVRIGRDVGVTWSGELAASSSLRDGVTRNFANGILWQADPDCILLRERFHHLSETEIRSLALFGGLLGGVLMTSDALEELSVERLRVWKFLLDAKTMSCRFPFLGDLTDPVLTQICEGENFVAAFFLNTGETTVTRKYEWKALGLLTPRSVLEWTENGSWEVKSENISVLLESHEGKLLLLEPR